MSYSRNVKRVLSGSWNLLQPGDKIPDTDGLQMENWRVDQDGELRSRGGALSVWSEDDQPYTWVHSIARRAGQYYYGVGKSLYRAPAVAAMATGFDGNPIPSVSYIGFQWFMNRGMSGKDNGTAFTPWMPAPPTAAIVVQNISTADPNGPTGTYQWWATYVTAAGFETNAGPPSAAMLFPTGSDVYLTVPLSPDPQVTQRKIYRSGGTLGQAYLVLTVNDNTTVGHALPGLPYWTIVDSMGDLAATEQGIALQTNHDAPVLMKGVCGPYQGRILGWSSAANVNRLWWTLPNQPQYWPGAALSVGNWVDVGDDGEEIVNVVWRARMAVIYKERSVWRLIGDPDSGYLERADSTTGLDALNAVVSAGKIDYFKGTEGIYTFDGDAAARISQNLDPIFRGQAVTIAGGVTIQPGDPSRWGQSALGYANGRLYFSYAEQGQTQNSVVLVYHEATGRWYSMRIGAAATISLGVTVAGFACFFYQNPGLWIGAFGSVMQLETGIQDVGIIDVSAIQLLYQSRYEDCGFPDNQKVFLDVTVECEAPSPVTVKVAFDNGLGFNATVLTRGTCTNATRGKTTFLVGALATNMSIRLECAAWYPVTVYAVYMSYYVEARLTETVSTIPVDLGSPQVKQVKEVQLDIDASSGPVTLWVESDLPGNSIASRYMLQVAASQGRRIVQQPFATVEGRLWQFSVYATAQGNLFRLYGMRALVRPIGVYVEAYEAAQGFVWDSMEQDFSKLKRFPPDQYNDPVKRARNLQFDIEADGKVTANLFSDLPGNAMAMRFTASIAASGIRQIVTLPMPQGLTAMVEGRIFRLQIAGAQQYKLFGARLEVIEMGVYVEGYEAAGGATYDSREVDFGSPKVKEVRELQLDIEATGPVTAQLLSDFPGFAMAVRATETFDTTAFGRRKIHLVVPQLEGRLWRLLIAGPSAFRLYGARLELRQFGMYFDSDEAGQGGFYDSTELDLGTRSAKEIREIEVELWAYAPVTVTVYLDLPGNFVRTALFQTIPATYGRRKFGIPMPQGTSAYSYGRLIRVTMTGTGAFKLFGARVNFRPIGTFVEAYEAAAGAVWDSTAVTLAGGKDVVIDQVRFEMDCVGIVWAAVYTDLPGEQLTLRATFPLYTGSAGRRWVTCEVPGASITGGNQGDTQGRTARVVLSSNSDFRLYQGQIAVRQVGRYLAAGVPDAFRSLDQDFGTERSKSFKKLELDCQTDGWLTLTVYTDQSGTIAAQFTTQVNTSGNRQTLAIVMPANIRGRLMRVEIGGIASGRLYGLRVWTRALNEPNAQWEWKPFPMEESQSLPEWTPLPVEPTPSEFQWAPLPVEPTNPQWAWQEFSVKPTDPQWSWGEFPVEPTPDTWEWVNVPMDQVS